MISRISQAFNPEQLNELLGDDAQAVAEVLEIACDALPPIVERLTEPDAPAAEARSLAHQLKGASLSAGAEELASIATGLEHALAQGWTPEAQELSGALPSAVGRFLAAASSYLRKTSR